MASKRAVLNEYEIHVTEVGSIVVYCHFGNVKAVLRQIAERKGFDYNPEWNTRQLGKSLIKAYGGGDYVRIDNYFVRRLPTGTIQSYRTYDNMKEALRQIAKRVGFSYEPQWTTRQLGNKLVKFLNGR